MSTDDTKNKPAHLAETNNGEDCVTPAYTPSAVADICKAYTKGVYHAQFTGALRPGTIYLDPDLKCAYELGRAVETQPTARVPSVRDDEGPFKIVKRNNNTEAWLVFDSGMLCLNNIAGELGPITGTNMAVAIAKFLKGPDHDPTPLPVPDTQATPGVMRERDDQCKACGKWICHDHPTASTSPPQHDSDCSLHNAGVPELLGPCDCPVSVPATPADTANTNCGACGAKLGERCRTMSDDQCDAGKHGTTAQPGKEPT